MIAAAAAGIFQQRNQAIEEWRRTLVGQTRMLAEHTNQVVKSADLVQKSIIDRIGQQGTTAGTDPMEHLGTRAFFDIMSDKISGVPQVDVATIVSGKGRVINFTRSHPPPDIELSDRDYFKAHMDDPSLSLFISSPVKNRGNGRWTFYLTRKISGTDGPIGLTLAGIESRYFSDYFKAVNFSAFSAINLYRADGMLLARYPERDDAMGKVFKDQPSLKALKEGLDSVVTTAPRALENSEPQLRIVAARAVADYPLVVAVTATEDLVLAQWRKESVFIALGCALLCTLFAGMMALILRLLAKRDAALESLGESESRLVEEGRLLATRNQELEDFAYVASHDLREPLRTISSYIALLTKRHGAAFDGESQEFIGFIQDGAKRLDRMVLDLLEYSRVGRTDSHHGLISLEDVAKIAMQNLRAIINESGADVQVLTPLPQVLGARTDLTRLLQNLIGNGLKYRHAERSPVIALSANDRGDNWEISIADNGIGIAPQYHERIFRIFQRLHTRQQYEGTGIGLAICRRVVEQHGGKIWLHSEPDKGTTFLFTLPKAGNTKTAP